MLDLLLFLALAAIIVLAAIGVVWTRLVVHSAIYLALTFICVAGLYVLLNAELLAAIQVLIYVGAIVVLIIFGIMLTGGGEEE
ncbi:MAG: NADH-quinone oxidoreductase subunit J [Methanocellales archaeon]